MDYTTEGRDGGLIFGENIFSGETAVREDGSPNTISVSAEDYYNRVGGRNTPVGEAFVRELSNIRFREMVLGYTLPQKMLSNTFLTSANFSFGGKKPVLYYQQSRKFRP